MPGIKLTPEVVKAALASAGYAADLLLKIFAGLPSADRTTALASIAKVGLVEADLVRATLVSKGATIVVAAIRAVNADFGVADPVESSAVEDIKQSVRCATTAALTGGVTYAAAGGSAGTGKFTVAQLVVDGVTLVAGNRVLVKDQADAKQNGIYTVLVPGTGITGIWERASDLDGTPGSEVTGGAAVSVEQGTTNIGAVFVLVGNGELTLNSNNIVWTQISGLGSVTAGPGIAKSGNTISALNHLQACVTASTANIDLTTGGLLTIDGVLLTAGARVLVKNQGTATQNGIYLAVAGTWTRAADWALASVINAGTCIPVIGAGGSASHWTTYRVDGATAVTVGTSSPVFTPEFVAGHGLYKTASTIQVTNFHQPCVVASTANIDLATGGLLTIDGVLLTAGQRVLVKNQGTGGQNGIYNVVAGAWTRATDWATGMTINPGAIVPVISGTTQSMSTFRVDGTTAVLVGSDTPTMVQDFIPGHGISKTGSTVAAVNYHQACVTASTANVDVGVGGLVVVDGITPIAGNRILLKNQTAPAENGIWIAAAGAWARAADWAATTTINYGALIPVQAGIENATALFRVSGRLPVVVGADTPIMERVGVGRSGRMERHFTLAEINAIGVVQTGQLALGTLPAGAYVKGGYVRNDGNIFATITALTGSIGLTGTPTSILGAGTIFAANATAQIAAAGVAPAIPHADQALVVEFSAGALETLNTATGAAAGVTAVVIWAS